MKHERRPVQVLPVPAARLGESPMWHPDERALYWCDLVAGELHRFDPGRRLYQRWPFGSELACCAPMPGGELLLARRDGLWRFAPRRGRLERFVDAPYDRRVQRFNDGKADPVGRFWVCTVHEPLDGPHAMLYRVQHGAIEAVAGGLTAGHGLAFSPDGRTLYCADAAAHAIHAFDFDVDAGTLSGRRPFARFPAPRGVHGPWGGRPDGAAVDREGGYWVAMFEGARLLRLSPRGETLQQVDLPVRCPTMACFGDDDLRTLYVTTSRERRPAAELAAQPWAGCVLRVRVDVPGLPVHFAQP